MLLNWLSQVTATRSDIYTAYILLRAYDNSDFNGGILEEYRLIAVFDRSGISQRTPTARLIGVKVVEVN